MRVRTLADLEQLGRIKFPADKSFRSARFWTAEDALGYSYNENAVQAGTDLTVWLKHHWEANYIISGTGEVTDLTRAQSWPLAPGTLYVVGPNDRHRLHLKTDECHLSIFHPPLTGEERFDEDGSYEPSGPVPKTERRMFVKTLEALIAEGKAQGGGPDTVRTVPLLTGADHVGFTLSHLALPEGGELPLGPDGSGQTGHILAGSGEIRDPASGQSWPLGPSVAFSLEPGEQAHLKAHSALELLSITNTP